MRFFATFVLLLISTALFSNPINGYLIIPEDDPLPLLSNFYDVNLYSPNGVVMRKQPSNAGGGTYCVFFGRETEFSTLRTYYAYLDNNGNVTNTSTISTDDLEETFPSLAIDPETGDPIVTWNSEITNDEMGVLCSYDLYHLGSPGLWKSPFLIFDDAVLHNPDDLFLNPIVEIGNSPFPAKRRIYVLAHNQREFITGDDYCHALLGYADFDVNDFNMQSEFSWNYRQLLITQAEYLHFSFTVGEEGRLAIIGYTSDQEVIACINENYGEGDFIYYEEDFKFPVDNPLNLDGTPRFTDDQGNPYDLYFGPQFAGNFNTIFAQNNEKIIFPTCFSLCAEPNLYLIDDCLLFPKVISFDLSMDEFDFIDIHLSGEYPDDDLPMLPWDIDENGCVDTYDSNGEVDWIPCWPIFFYDHFPPYAFNYNNLRITQNEDNGLISVLWNESTKPFFANNMVLGLIEWDGVPEIGISYSNDSGETWFPTQCFNSINNPEFDNIIPEFIFPSSEIIDQGYGEYQLQSIFFDDNSYSPPGWHPSVPGGEVSLLTLDFIIDEPNNYMIFNEPNAASVWQTGSWISIAWNTSGTTLPIKFDLVDDNDEFVCRISENPTYPSFNWYIPNTIPSGDDYQVRAMVLSPPGYERSLPFSIYNPNNTNQIIKNEIKLFQNIPNPFNPSTTISFSVVQSPSTVELSIFNLKGQKVKVLECCNSFAANTRDSCSTYSIIWDGTDDSGKPVSSGVYLYKLKAGEVEESKKMLLLR